MGSDVGSQCAWCGAILQPPVTVDAAVSHALCPACHAKLRESLHAKGLHIVESEPGSG